MSRKPGAFHKNHGKDVQLLEEDTVAHRVGRGYMEGVVFTSQPIPMFQVKLLEKGSIFGAPIVSGV